MDKNIDRSKLFIISVDGLDVSGKETFCKHLKYTIKTELVDKSLLNANITVVSFPRYETSIGSDIKRILDMDISKRTLENNLEELFTLDRIEFFNEYFRNDYDESKMNIIICDRYSYSNFIYSHIKIMNELDIPTRTMFKEQAREKLKKEMEQIPIPDITILFNRVSEQSRTIHKELLKNKVSKDKNETEEIQEYLSKVIQNELLDTITEFSSKVMVIPVGSNFGSDQIEKGITTLIVSKMVENGMDSIIYPSNIVYKNNETLSLIGDLNFIPSVEIKFLLDKSLTQINKFKQDVLNGLEKRKVLDTISNPMNIVNKNNLDYYPMLLESFIDDIQLNIKEIDSVEEYLDYKINKELLTPKKNSKLDCNYTILTYKDLIIPAKSVVPVDFGVEIHSIESISQKTLHKIIDLDVKTSKECILKYGVGVADSPSSISSDYRGNMSIILINHTDKDAIIPFGFPIASLVVKDSSCETLFTLLEK